jgi:hypothetical protein
MLTSSKRLFADFDTTGFEDSPSKRRIRDTPEKDPIDAYDEHVSDSMSSSSDPIEFAPYTMVRKGTSNQAVLAPDVRDPSTIKRFQAWADNQPIIPVNTYRHKPVCNTPVVAINENLREGWRGIKLSDLKLSCASWATDEGFTGVRIGTLNAQGLPRKVIITTPIMAVGPHGHYAWPYGDVKSQYAESKYGKSEDKEHQATMWFGVSNDVIEGSDLPADRDIADDTNDTATEFMKWMNTDLTRACAVNLYTSSNPEILRIIEVCKKDAKTEHDTIERFGGKPIPLAEMEFERFCTHGFAPAATTKEVDGVTRINMSMKCEVWKKLYWIKKHKTSEIEQYTKDVGNDKQIDIWKKHEKLYVGLPLVDLELMNAGLPCHVSVEDSCLGDKGHAMSFRCELSGSVTGGSNGEPARIKMQLVPVCAYTAGFLPPRKMNATNECINRAIRSVVWPGESSRSMLTYSSSE